MKKILLICVNYNSYDALHYFLESVDCAAKRVKERMQINVAIADNSTEIKAIDAAKYADILLHTYVTNANLGYLGGVKYVLQNISDEEYQSYQYVAISNADVTIEKSFFEQLDTIETTNVGWIAPAIISKKEQKDRNPKIITRPSKRHMQIAELLYIHPLIYNLYVRLIYKNRSPRQSATSTAIYAGHGSFMLFCCPLHIKKIISKFTPFLFCEEHFFAEEMRACGLSVIYHPEMIIYDEDHVSTSTIPSRSYCRYNREAIQFIINYYFT